MNKKIITISLILIVVASLGIFLYGCAPQPTPANNQNQTNQQIPPINNVSGVIFNNVVDANNQFAFDLYKNWASREGNMFFSPYSISSALAMTYEGAKGKTADEMQKVLHFPADSNARRSGFSQINAQINGKDKPYALATANALWAQNGYPFSQDYLNIVEQTYGGKATNLDFKKNSEGSRKTINAWVENKTNNKIVDLIPSGSITAATRLVLTNAIYFKANWTSQFDKDATYDADFNTSSNTIKTPMMHDGGNFNYVESSDLQVLELPYLGDDLSMLIILPRSSLSSVEASLDATKLTQLRTSLKTEDVAVSLPTFKMETTYLMAEDLPNMGMPTAFSDKDANFSGMTSANEQFYISQVIHQAFVNVTESGTEAAGATAVIIAGITAIVGEQPQPKIFNADHPFIFIIQQKDTGNMLFMGRMSDPSK